MSDLSLHHSKQAVERLDYCALNDDSDSEAEAADWIESSPKHPHLATVSSQDLDQFIEWVLLYKHLVYLYFMLKW